MSRIGVRWADAAMRTRRTSHSAAWLVLLWSLPDATAAQAPDLETLTSVGGSDAPLSEQFTLLGSARILADGCIALVDAGPNEIRVFDRAGRHLRTLGRAGGGPGEFSASPALIPQGDGGFVAFDLGSRRLASYSPDGTMEWDRSLREGAIGPSVVAADAESRFIMRAADPVRISGSPASGRPTFELMDRRVEVRRHVGGPESEAEPAIIFRSLLVTAWTEGSNYHGWPPLEPPPWTVGDHERAVVVRSDSADVLVMQLVTGQVDTVAIQVAREPLTSDFLRGVRARLKARAQPMQRPAIDLVLDRLRHPRFLPIMADVRLGGDEAIWLKRFELAELETWDLYSLETGAHGGRLELPEGLRLLDIRGDLVLTEKRDAYDVPTVELHRFTVATARGER